LKLESRNGARLLAQLCELVVPSFSAVMQHKTTCLLRRNSVTFFRVSSHSIASCASQSEQAVAQRLSQPHSHKNVKTEPEFKRRKRWERRPLAMSVRRFTRSHGSNSAISWAQSSGPVRRAHHLALSRRLLDTRTRENPRNERGLSLACRGAKLFLISSFHPHRHLPARSGLPKPVDSSNESHVIFSLTLT
jgi:hypothetical protein